MNGAHATEVFPGHDRVALLQGTVLNQQRRDRPAALVQFRFDDDALGGAFLHGGQFEDFRL